MPVSADRDSAAEDALPSGSDLATIMRAAPFGMRVSGPDGSIVFDHDGLGKSMPQQRLGMRRYVADHPGGPFEVVLTLDETESHRREQDLIQKAYFDALTKLPNRALIERSVATLIDGRSDRPFALVFLDLDGFKSVNDYYGHDAGDQLLVTVTQRLQSCLRPTDMLARLSGDEFALLIAPVDDEEALRNDLKWLSERIKAPVFADGNEILTSASMGVCLFPKDGRSFEELRSNADRAMYKAKGAAKGTVQFFDAGIEHAAAEKGRAERRLRLAIRDRRVCCAYQPKVEIGSA